MKIMAPVSLPAVSGPWNPVLLASYPTSDLIGSVPDQSWVGTFCLTVDDDHVPGLQHTLDGDHDNPDVTTTTTGTVNGISIFQRGYTVRVSGVLWLDTCTACP